MGPLRVITTICLCKILRFEFNLILLLFVYVMFRIYHIRIKNQAIFGGIFNFFDFTTKKTVCNKNVGEKYLPDNQKIEFDELTPLICLFHCASEDEKLTRYFCYAKASSLPESPTNKQDVLMVCATFRINSKESLSASPKILISALGAFSSTLKNSPSST